MDLLTELQNLEPKEIGLASLPIRIGAIVIACLLVLGGGYYYLLKPKFADLERAKSKEKELRNEFLSKAKRAASLQEYKEQVREVERLLTIMKQQLPKEAEIPDLLVDISQTALASGLEIERFEPRAEQRQELGYIKQPISLKMTGSYEDFGAFVSGVASLPRIVTIENMSLAPTGGKGRPQQGVKLSMDAVAATYRYSEDGG